MKKIVLLSLVSLFALLSLFGCTNVENGESETKDYTADEILAAIRDAYGEDYLPNTPIEEEMLTGTFLLDMEKVEDVAAEMPMIGFHPDRVIVVKAKPGEGEAVEQSLKSAREKLVEESIWYPANTAKINASKVLRNGDYVCFLLVGAPDDVSETDEAAAKFAEEETKKAENAFNALFA